MMTHWISMAGLRGCLPSYCEVSRTKQEAIDSVCFIHDIGRYSKFRKELEQFNFTDLHLHDWQAENKNDVPFGPTYPGHGNEYAEVIECDCPEPWIHQDDLPPEKWIEEHGQDFGITEEQRLDVLADIMVEVIKRGGKQ